MKRIFFSKILPRNVFLIIVFFLSVQSAWGMDTEAQHLQDEEIRQKPGDTQQPIQNIAQQQNHPHYTFTSPGPTYLDPFRWQVVFLGSSWENAMVSYRCDVFLAPVSLIGIGLSKAQASAFISVSAETFKQLTGNENNLMEGRHLWSSNNEEEIVKTLTTLQNTNLAPPSICAEFHNRLQQKDFISILLPDSVVDSTINDTEKEVGSNKS